MFYLSLETSNFFPFTVAYIFLQNKFIKYSLSIADLGWSILFVYLLGPVMVLLV